MFEGARAWKADIGVAFDKSCGLAFEATAEGVEIVVAGT